VQCSRYKGKRCEVKQYEEDMYGLRGKEDVHGTGRGGGVGRQIERAWRCKVKEEEEEVQVSKDRKRIMRICRV